MARRDRVVTIPGEPVGKPRQTRYDRWRERPAVVRYRAWCDHARATVLEELGARALEETPLEVHVGAWFGRPRRPRRGQEEGAPHRQKPDVDNVLKAVIDALWERDELVAMASIRCAWDDGAGPRLVVTWRS